MKTRPDLLDEDAHPHRLLSPDGKRGFFNAAESGTLAADMVEGLDTL